jgi:hypothetical protein
MKPGAAIVLAVPGFFYSPAANGRGFRGNINSGNNNEEKRQ